MTKRYRALTGLTYPAPDDYARSVAGDTEDVRKVRVEAGDELVEVNEDIVDDLLRFARPVIEEIAEPKAKLKAVK